MHIVKSMHYRESCCSNAEQAALISTSRLTTAAGVSVLECKSLNMIQMNQKVRRKMNRIKISRKPMTLLQM